MALLQTQTYLHSEVFGELISLGLVTPAIVAWAKLFKHLKEQGISYSLTAMQRVIWLNTCHIIRFLKL